MNHSFYKKFLADQFGVVSFVINTESNQLVFASESLLHLLGKELSPTEGKTLVELFPCAARSLPALESLSAQEPLFWTFYSPILDTEFSMKDMLFHHEEGIFRLSYGQNSKMESAQVNKLWKNHAEDRAIIVCAQVLLDRASGEESVDKLLKTVAEFYQAERGFICEFDNSKEILTNTYEVCLDSASPRIQDLQEIPTNALKPWMSRLEQEDFLYLEVNDSDTFPEFPKKMGIDCLLLAAICQNGQITGFLGVDKPKNLPINPQLLLTVAAFVENEMEHQNVAVTLMETVNDLQKSLDMSKMMFQCAEILIQDGNTDATINSLLQVLGNYVGADRAYVFQLKKNERVLANTHTCQLDGQKSLSNTLSEIHLSAPLYNSLGVFFQEDWAYVRRWDKKEEQKSCAYEMLQLFNSESCILAPFQKNGEFQGLLGLDNPKTNLEHKEVVTTVSGFIVNTLEKRGILNKLEYLSYADELTGLKNRMAYLQRVKELKRLKLNNFGVIFADINDLKSVNELFGQEAGDAMILWSVKFLQAAVRDPIYRIGGDEFVCFIPGISKERFEERLAKLAKAQERMEYINLAFGCVWEENVTDLDDVIFAADKAMFQDKERVHELTRTSRLIEEDCTKLLRKRIREIKRVEE